MFMGVECTDLVGWPIRGGQAWLENLSISEGMLRHFTWLENLSISDTGNRIIVVECTLY